MALELGALVPYSDQVSKGYRLASFVPSRPRLGHQFTTSVSRDGQDGELFSFTVPMQHETLAGVEPEDARMLEDVTQAILDALPPGQQYDQASAKAALGKVNLPPGIDLTWP